MQHLTHKQSAHTHARTHAHTHNVYMLWLMRTKTQTLAQCVQTRWLIKHMFNVQQGKKMKKTHTAKAPRTQLLQVTHILIPQD